MTLFDVEYWTGSEVFPWMALGAIVFVLLIVILHGFMSRNRFAHAKEGILIRFLRMIVPLLVFGLALSSAFGVLNIEPSTEDSLRGWALLAHVVLAGALLACFPFAALAYFRRSPHGVGHYGHAPIRFLLLFSALLSALSMLLSMTEIATTELQETLLSIHRLSGLAAVLAGILTLHLQSLRTLPRFVKPKGTPHSS